MFIKLICASDEQFVHDMQEQNPKKTKISIAKQWDTKQLFIYLTPMNIYTYIKSYRIYPERKYL